ncbi:MAG: hypothetical protein GY799_29365, partial [Desulfobulbaceae bacterium]|nr:hypothetical protein [Desulfobulbaceae bacterium]
MTTIGRNKLQQIRDAKFEELLTLGRDVFKTAIDLYGSSDVQKAVNTGNQAYLSKVKWFDKSAYYTSVEEITLSSIYEGIAVGGQNTIVLASLTQTSEYYLYSNYHTGTLSSRLRASASQMQNTVNGIMRTHIKAKTTWKRVQKDLNKVGASIGDVPKWLTELEQTAQYYGGHTKEVQQSLKVAKRAIKKLRPDRELRRKYLKVIEAVERPNFDSIALKRATSKAIVEKAMYNNERIVRSELARAYNDAFWRRVKDTPEITLVRSVLSSAHSKPDQCDHFAEVDAFGMGAGVYP